MKAECKFLELCLLQRSAKVRSSALLAISDFLPPSQNVKNICQLLFLKWRNESGVFCYIKKFAKSKGKGLISIFLLTQVLSFFTQIVIFLFQFQCVLVVLIFLFPFLFVFTFLGFPFQFFVSTTYLLVPMFQALFCPPALLARVLISLHAVHFLPLFCSHLIPSISPKFIKNKIIIYNKLWKIVIQSKKV